MRGVVRTALFVVALVGMLSELPRASARADGPGEVEALVEQMGAGEVDKRYPAYTELLKRRSPAIVAPLVAKAETWDLSAQSYAVSLLGNLPPADAKPAWQKWLGSASPYLRP